VRVNRSAGPKVTKVVSRSASFLATASIALVAGCGGGGDEAQAPSNGGTTAVEGTVTDSGGNPVEGALLQASADDPATILPDIALLTDRAGHYRWELGPGSYELSVSKDGFRTAAKRVTLGRGRVVDLDFTLEPA
jgi:hypothetical protein